MRRENENMPGGARHDTRTFRSKKFRRGILAVAIASAAVSASATAATTATTAPAAVTTAAAPTTSATVAAATTASSTATFTLRAGFVDHKSAAEEILAVESGDHFFGFGIVFNFGEAKTARLSCETIAEQGERIRLHADFREKRGYLLFRGFEREIPNVEFLHGRSPCAPIQGRARVRG